MFIHNYYNQSLYLISAMLHFHVINGSVVFVIKCEYRVCGTDVELFMDACHENKPEEEI